MAPGGAGRLVRAGVQELAVPLPPAPKLITFDAEGTLLQLASPKGLILRESLLKAHGYLARLPGPDLFQASHAAYDKALNAATAAQPCYGCGTGVTSHQWWYGVVYDALVETLEAHNIPPSEMVDPVMEELFDELFYETFTGPEAYELRPDAARTLEKLAEWREAGTGPLLGIVTNADERLPTVLLNLGILEVFDFVLTSRQIGSELPARAIFDVALDKAGLTNAAEALHCGDDLERDIGGAAAAGWQSCLIANPPAPQGPQAYTVMGISGLLPRLGLPALSGPVPTTRRRGQFVDGE
ncbi:HAD-like domain-containing protein [Tribonema minus]|uniref:HAD-like domain-containing protein n=1 Tax=Tribonema minus TaxID=303371 RepID=A0A835YZN2_9STRA|nr:HAD-like domain-containing protein [Tribonema minus]